jgi:hypothetical protein
MEEQKISNLGGMTVNERLIVTGLLDRWDAAVRKRDRREMLEILVQIEITEPAPTVDAVLADPQRFGF